MGKTTKDTMIEELEKLKNLVNKYSELFMERKKNSPDPSFCPNKKTYVRLVYTNNIIEELKKEVETDYDSKLNQLYCITHIIININHYKFFNFIRAPKNCEPDIEQTYLDDRILFRQIFLKFFLVVKCLGVENNIDEDTRSMLASIYKTVRDLNMREFLCEFG